MYNTTTTSSSSSPQHSLDYATRGPSLDESIASDPFVDRSLYDPSVRSSSRSRNSHSSSNSRSSSRVRQTTTEGGRNPWSPLSSENGDSPSPPPITTTDTSRPGLPTSTSDLSRQISAALSEDLPNEPISSEPPTPNPNGNGNGNGWSSMNRKRSESGATLKARNSSSTSGGGSSNSFLSQFRSGSGWFAPMVEPEKPLSREEFAAKEKIRIEKLKAGKSASRRPGLMKRLSSGLELSGFGGGGGSASPSKR
ncbi:hypothetical protein JCM3765_006177 [Sporobolomyces pararoseus]